MKLKLLSNISIKSKLLLIVMVPMAIILLLTGLKINILLNKVDNQSDIVDLMNISESAANLVHNTQFERGASAGYIKTNGRAFADELLRMHEQTDEKAAQFKAILQNIDTRKFGQEYHQQIQDAVSALSKLDSMRSDIRSFKISLSDSITYYTDMNRAFINIMKQSLFVAEDITILRDVSAYLYLLQIKEQVGLEKAIGTVGFAGGWTPTLRDELRDLAAKQEAFLNVFLTYATASEKELYHKKTKHTSFDEVKRMRDLALANENDIYTASQQISAKEWFITMSDKIDQLKAVKDYLATHFNELAVS